MHTNTLLVAWVLLSVVTVWAAPPASRPVAGTHSSPPPRLGVPYASTAPRGRAEPDDPAWVHASLIPALTPSLSTEAGLPAPLGTEVRLLWDEQFLYVRFTCQSDSLYAPFHGRDADHYKGDVVEVFLDPKADGREWVELEVTPENQVLDQITLLTADPRSGPDLRLVPEVYPRDAWTFREWNLEGLKTEVSQQKQDGKLIGWTVDLALPAKPLLKRLAKSRYEADLTMRLNLMRYDYKPAADPTAPRNLSAMNWAPVIRGCPHFSPEAMGYITLLPRQRDGTRP